MAEDNQNQENQDKAKIVKFVGDKNAMLNMIKIAREAEAKQFKNEQPELMKPLVTQESISDEDKAFLDLILEKLEKGEIDLFHPSSLLNHGVYDGLAEPQRAKIDTYTMGMLSTTRRIKDLKDLKGVDEKMTYQMTNLIRDFRLKKETIEKKFGDVFII